MRSIITFLAAMTVAFTAMTTLAKNTADPTGTWKIDVITEGETTHTEAIFTKEGKGFKGSHHSPETDHPMELYDVYFESGNQLEFSAESDQGYTISYKGTIKGNIMRGTAETVYLGNRFYSSFSATRESTANPIGTWKISLNAPDGNTYHPKATITKTEGGLKGSYYSPASDQNVDLQDVEIDSSNRLRFTVTNQGTSIEYTGKIERNSMKGSAQIDYQGQQYDADFSATR